VSRSWERIETAGNAGERGSGAVRRRAGQGLGRVWEAGAVPHRGRNERKTQSQSTELGTGDPAMATAVCRDRRERQLSEAEHSSEFFIRQSVSSLPELSKLTDTEGIYFRKKD